MAGEYTTVFDLGQQAMPLLPLGLLALLAVFIAGLLFAAKRRIGRGLALTLCGSYLSYAAAVGFGYWSIWQQQAVARNPAAVVVEIGRIQEPQVRGEGSGLYLDVHQRFTVNDEAFDYAHRSIRVIDFLFPNVEPVPLPLVHKAHVRVTYRGEGADRQVLKFEIATADLAQSQAE